MSKGPRHKGDFYIETPITFPIHKPKEIYLRSLKTIRTLIKKKYENKVSNNKQEKFIYKKKLIEELEIKGFIELESKHEDPSRRKSALYMKSTNFLEPLVKEMNYIKISDDKRNKKVYLTEVGKDILKIFKFLI